VTTLSADFNLRVGRRRAVGRAFEVACALAAAVGILVLVALLVEVFGVGWKWLSWRFFTRFPSVMTPENSGIKSALLGSMWLILITTVVSVPVGVSAGIYLQEYARDTWVTRLIRLNIANLAGVPSIVYGLLGLAVFVRWMSLDRSLISGALTLSLLVLPVIIISTREALAAVPRSLREAAYAIGATRWQTVRAHVLPAALSGILTGVILSLSRAVGEAAPLIMIGALTHIAFVPEKLTDPFTALPIQIYNWTDQPDHVFRELAAAGIIVLLVILLAMNALAVGLRLWGQGKHSGWT
jgi:phosphate transport system permease protein